MGRKPKRSRPSFFKVLCREDFNSQLRIPPVFMRKHGEILPRNVILKTKSGKSWVVGIEEIEEGHFFTQGWTKFTDDVETKFGEFLVFYFDGKSTFDVSIYETTCCEKEFNSHGESPLLTQTDDEEYRIFEINDAKDCKVNNAAAEKEQLRNTIGKDKAAGTSAGHECTFNDKNPHFIMELKTHQRSRASIPKNFAEKSGIIHKTVVVLMGPEERVWPVYLDRRGSHCFRLDMAKGWSDFRKEYLAYGDTCLFEFIPSRNLIKVHIHKKPSDA